MRELELFFGGSLVVVGEGAVARQWGQWQRGGISFYDVGTLVRNLFLFWGKWDQRVTCFGAYPGQKEG